MACILDCFKISILILSVTLLSCFCFIPQSFATDGFEPPVFKLPHKPTICAFEPPSDPNFPNLGNKLLSETEYAILDWQTKLNQGLGRHPAWDMNLLKISLGQQNGFDYSKCDITINYEPKPKDPTVQLKEVGVTFFDPSPPKAHIIIYYLGINQDILYKSWNSGNWHFWQYTPVMEFTGFLASDPQLQETIRHELGHSFGLGHYIVSPEALRAINLGQRDPPSIMLTSEMTQGVTHYDITPVDIDEVKSIYGLGGFGSSPLPSVSTPAPSQTVDKTTSIPFDSLTAHAYAIGNDSPRQWFLSVDGFISGQYYGRGNQIEIIITNHNGDQIFDQSFLTTNQISQTIDMKYWQDGVYNMRVKYGAYESSDISFVKSDISDKNQISPYKNNKSPNYGSVSSILRSKNLPLPMCNNISIMNFQMVLPSWTNKIIKLWAEGLISDEDISKSLVYARECTAVNG